MEIDELDARLARLTETLAHLLDGRFEDIGGYPEVADDALGRIEETLQFLIMDIKTVTLANREKEASLVLQQERLERQLREIRARDEMIRGLSTPMLEVWDEILVLPLVGALDPTRSAEITDQLLAAVARTGTRWVILDVTGVAIVDTFTAESLVKIVRAASLLGCECVLCGIQPAVAQTLASLDAELGTPSLRNLRAALRYCLARTHA